MAPLQGPVKAFLTYLFYDHKTKTTLKIAVLEEILHILSTSH